MEKENIKPSIPQILLSHPKPFDGCASCIPDEDIVDDEDLPPEYQEFLRHLIQLQCQKGAESRDTLAHKRQISSHQLINQQIMAPSYEFHARAASAETEKFPDLVPDNDVYPFDFSITIEVGRSRSNTYQRVFMPRNLKSRSMSHAEMVAEVMTDEAVVDMHTSLTTLPSPPDLNEVRTRRATIKVNRRGLISDIIRPATQRRAQAILDRPLGSFVSGAEYIQMNETAKHVIYEVAKLSARAEVRDEELLQEQRRRNQHQATRAAELKEVSARLSMMKRRWASGELPRDITRGSYGGEGDPKTEDTLAALEGRRVASL